MLHASWQGISEGNHDAVMRHTGEGKLSASWQGIDENTDTVATRRISNSMSVLRDKKNAPPRRRVHNTTKKRTSGKKGVQYH